MKPHNFTDFQLKVGSYSCGHCIDQEIEVQRGEIVCPKSHSQEEVEGFEPRQLGSRVPTFNQDATLPFREVCSGSDITAAPPASKHAGRNPVETQCLLNRIWSFYLRLLQSHSEFKRQAGNKVIL